MEELAVPLASVDGPLKARVVAGLLKADLRSWTAAQRQALGISQVFRSKIQPFRPGRLWLIQPGGSGAAEDLSRRCASRGLHSTPLSCVLGILWHLPSATHSEGRKPASTQAKF